MDESTKTVKALSEETWDDFARIAARHNGVWGGCWCLAFHEEGGTVKGSAEKRRDKKLELVCADRSHAALVYLGEEVVGWCQYGRREELPRIKHKKQYEKEMKDLPDWRITCFFVDKDHRGQGISQFALHGALELIREKGGGIVESYPEEVGERKVSSSFLHNADIGIFEKEGFSRFGRLGSNHWIMRKTI